MTRDEIHHQLDRMLDVYVEAIEGGFTAPTEATTNSFLMWLETEWENHCDEFGNRSMDDWLHETVDAWDNALGGMA